MAKRTKMPTDVNQRGKAIVDIASGLLGESAEEAKVPEKGRAGGLKGGKARAEKLTPEERSEVARKAARASWANHQD